MSYAEDCKKWLVDQFKGSIRLNGLDKKNKQRCPHILFDSSDIHKMIFGRASCFSYEKEGFCPQSDAHHLNSSQTFCINFFEPLRKTRVDVLQSLLRVWGIKLKGKIVHTEYEKLLSVAEDTHFDFYIETDLNERVFVEMKYTENEFGKFPEWKNESARMRFYADWLSYSKNLCNFFKENDLLEFKRNYQILRNISYIRSNSDYCLFVFPRGNKPLRDEFNNFKKLLGHGMCNVGNAYSDEIIMDLSAAFEMLGSPSSRIVNHYRKLLKTYFGWYEDVLKFDHVDKK